MSAGVVVAGAVGATTSEAAGMARALGIDNCPQPPVPPGTPAPTSVTGPSVPGQGGGTATVTSSDGSTPLGSPVCQWTYDLPSQAGDPTVTFTYLGAEYLALSTSYGVDYSSYYGVSCDTQVEVLNGFGGGGAQETLTGSSCNTDGYTNGESTVQVVGSGFNAGPVQTVASFNSTVTSFVSGFNVFFGIFTACSENPVGQRSTYNCDYFDGGPLY